MNRFTWRSWIATLPMAALLAIVAIATSPPTAAALTPATKIIQEQVVAELKKLDNVSFRVAWVHDDVGWATMPSSARNDHDRFKVDAMANTNPAATKINASPQPGARVQPNNNDVRGGSTYSTETMQPASNTANYRTPTLRGGVILASTAGGGWVETALALLHGRYEGRVS